MEIKSWELGVTEIGKVVKIFGAHFSNNHCLFYKTNFETIEKSLRESLKGCNWRGLTLLGKMKVIKSFAIPNIFVPGFSYLRLDFRRSLVSGLPGSFPEQRLVIEPTLISAKKDFIKKINNLLYPFIWKGKDKVKRAALINTVEKGELKMPDIESMIKA